MCQSPKLRTILPTVAKNGHSIPPIHSFFNSISQFHLNITNQNFMLHFVLSHSHTAALYFFLFFFVLFFVICDSGKKTHMLMAVKRSIIESFQYYIAITKFNGVLMSR